MSGLPPFEGSTGARSPDTGPGRTAVERLRPRHQRDDRAGEEEHDEQVGDRRQSEGEREAAHVTDRDEVENHGREQGARVGGDYRPPSPRPRAFVPAAQPSAFAYLVTQSFEEHDERVGGDADGD